MPATRARYRQVRQPTQDVHFNDGHHGITSKLLYQLMTILIVSILIPIFTITIIGTMDITMSKHEMTCLLIFSLGCPTVAIVVVSCIILWQFEVAQMRNYELEMT
jgi:hypothetical protein